MKKLKMSLILNILITTLVSLGSIFMFTGFRFMPSNASLDSSKIEMFKYFTVDSNILVGIISLILLIYEIKVLNKKISSIPNFIYVLKLIGTSAVTLTFLVTATFLVPQYGVYNLYSNTNLFFHLIVPLLAILSYILFEKHDNKNKYAFLGIIPMFFYSIYYTLMILINLDNGGLTYKYDFYGFLQGNINNIFIVIPAIYLIMYFISLVIIVLNRKMSVK